MITLESPKSVNRLAKRRLRRVFSEYYGADFDNAHPMIRIRGKHLATLGFHVGDTIEVQLEFGRIIISKVNGTVLPGGS